MLVNSGVADLPNPDKTVPPSALLGSALYSIWIYYCTLKPLFRTYLSLPGARRPYSYAMLDLFHLFRATFSCLSPPLSSLPFLSVVNLSCLKIKSSSPLVTGSRSSPPSSSRSPPPSSLFNHPFPPPCSLP